MSKPVHKAGQAGPFLTVTSRFSGDRKSANFTIEGAFEDLEALSDSEILLLIPSGFAIKNTRIDPTDVGMGKMVVSATEYVTGAGQTNVPIRTTFAINMAEVVYDLIDHDALAGEPHGICEKWLATDESDRVSGSGQNLVFRYRTTDGLETISNDAALKFCRAYLAGIKTFNKYFPVVSKVSIYTNPPGLNVSGGSFTGGSPTFSSNIGKYNDPPISLNGYPTGDWFKSRDRWNENANRTWNRDEEWTYTPEGSSGQHAWIYAEQSAGGGENGGGGS